MTTPITSTEESPEMRKLIEEVKCRALEGVSQEHSQLIGYPFGSPEKLSQAMVEYHRLEGSYHSSIGRFKVTEDVERFDSLRNEFVLTYRRSRAEAHWQEQEGKLVVEANEETYRVMVQPHSLSLGAEGFQFVCFVPWRIDSCMGGVSKGRVWYTVTIRLDDTFSVEEGRPA